MTRKSRLSTQIAIAIVGVGVIELCIVVGVVVGYLYFLDQSWLKSLSGPTRNAIILMRSGGMPSPELVEAAVRADQQLNATGAADVFPMIIILSLVALSFCIGAGTALGVWLARPLASVASAARQVADGDLGARADTHVFASTDTARLVADFNIMAASLQRAANELKENTAAIAHELRTPLTVLHGRLHGLADGVFDFTPAEIAPLLRQVEGLTRIVEDLRTVTLADTGRLDLHLTMINIAREAASVAEAFRTNLEASGIELKLSLLDVWSFCDGDRLRQAMLAGLENVRLHASDSNAVHLATGLEHTYAYIRILDCGPGLSEEALEHAFVKFWRGDASRSRKTGGSGLGLSVVKAIAAAHGGEATLSNRLGGGTCLEIRMPLSASSNDLWSDPRPNLHASST